MLLSQRYNERLFFEERVNSVSQAYKGTLAQALRMIGEMRGVRYVQFEI